MAFVTSGAGLATCPPPGTEASRVAPPKLRPKPSSQAGSPPGPHLGLRPQPLLALPRPLPMGNYGQGEVFSRYSPHQADCPPALIQAVKTPSKERRPVFGRGWAKACGLQPASTLTMCSQSPLGTHRPCLSLPHSLGRGGFPGHLGTELVLGERGAGQARLIRDRETDSVPSTQQASPTSS